MKIKKIIGCILCIAIIVALAYSSREFFQNPTNTFVIEKGEIRQEETTDGYILREEVVVKGENYKNGIVPIKAEGDKVAKNNPIFRYYSTGENALIEQIAALDVQINEVMGEEKITLPNDVKTLESQIDTYLEKIYTLNDLQKVADYKKSIQEAITKKAKIAGDQSPAGSKLKQLIEQRSALENQLNGGTEYLTAPMSGVVSYKVDGLEDICTTKDFSYVSKKFLQDLKLKSNQMIANSEECAKVVNNYEGYIAFIAESENAQNAKQGDTIYLRLPSGQEVKAEIVYVVQENKDETLCVVKIKNNLQELLNYRKITIDIIWWSDEGLKVPNVAIQTEEKQLTDGTTQEISYIYRKRAGYNEKVYIQVLRSNEKYAIIENYDEAKLGKIANTEEEITSKREISLYDEIVMQQ